MKTRKFIDRVKMYAHAGNGGHGSVSFRREKFVPMGGPDGGDGGKGGSVILRCDADTDSLIHLHFSPHQRAKNAGGGKGKQMHGRNGEDCIVKVPPGTEVWDVETDTLLGDITEVGQELRVARGGKGGLGNCHWKSSTHQAPRDHTEGIPGDIVSLRLELKLVAGIGLVGFPNAGKSSLLTAISDAHPRIGAYPFTTLNPIIGTLIFEDYSRITVADIPGLIEGAHIGVGLGDAFLRHIERAAALIYVVDMAGTDGRKPEEDYLKLKHELHMYSESLLERPELVVANKMDVEVSAENLETFIRETGVTPIPISAMEKTGLAELKQAIFELSKTNSLSK